MRDASHQPSGSRCILVLVRDTDNSREKLDAVCRFLANENFKVIGLDSHLIHHKNYEPVGNSFFPAIVYVAAINRDSSNEDSYRLWVTSYLGIVWEPIGFGPLSGAVTWIEFDGDPDSTADLDYLLVSVARSCLQVNGAEPLRREIIQRAPLLSQATAQCYESKGFLESYAARWNESLPHEQLREFLSHMPERAVVLDAGCGPGHHSRFIASKGHQVLALDQSAASMRIASQDCPEPMSLVRADINDLPFSPAIFDGVWCCATLVHFPIEALSRPLAELRRVLKPCGILSFSVSIGKLPAVESDGRFFDSFPDESQLRLICSHVGLEIPATRLYISGHTTSGGRRLARWITVLARQSVRATGT